MHERPTTQDDEGADGMKTDPGDFPPSYAQDRDRARRDPTPIRRRQLIMLEAGPEKMEVNDPANGEPLGNIEPGQAFHWLGLTRKARQGQADETVLARGLEPPRVAPYGPEPYASASSATRA